MHTMLDFITYTKGIEYLIALAFIIAFLVFWQFMHGAKMNRVMLTVLTSITLGLVVLAGSCIGNGP